MTVRIVTLMVLASLLGGAVSVQHVPGIAGPGNTAQNTPAQAQHDDWNWEDPGATLDWRYAGDQLVIEGLIEATAKVTGLPRLQVQKALDAGKTIVQIAGAEEQPLAKILIQYDKRIQQVFDAAYRRGQFPLSLATGQAAWYKAAARQMIDQPGLKPAYPGLHQLHGSLIAATMRVAGVERSVIRQELMDCHTLEEILIEHGYTGQMAVEAAMQRLTLQMDRLVAEGKLSPALRTRWETSLKAALEKMVATPGMHVAGRHCSH